LWCNLCLWFFAGVGELDCLHLVLVLVEFDRSLSK
jgi:hypothetical protein